VNSGNIFEGSTKMITLPCDLRIEFYKVRKLYIGAGTIDQYESLVEPKNQWGNKEGRQVIWQRNA
jgi:hypothetical protein